VAVPAPERLGAGAFWPATADPGVSMSDILFALIERRVVGGLTAGSIK
jgi:hypothetical protein